MYVAKEGYQCKPGIQCQLFKINVERHSGLSLQRYFTLRYLCYQSAEQVHLLDIFNYNRWN